MRAVAEVLLLLALAAVGSAYRGIGQNAWIRSTTALRQTTADFKNGMTFEVRTTYSLTTP